VRFDYYLEIYCLTFASAFVFVFACGVSDIGSS
jgi:hypothetical protein